MQKIFLDNNGTTPIDPRVVAAMLAELEAGPSNPSSIHSFGRAAHQRLSRAREQIASYLGVKPSELIFTSSGTEALNMAILGLYCTRPETLNLDRAKAPGFNDRKRVNISNMDPFTIVESRELSRRSKSTFQADRSIKSQGQILTTQIEHAAVYETLKRLGRPISYLPIGPEGHVKISDVEAALQSNISMIVLSAVNSETGVKNPIAEIGEIAERHQIPFIVDGVAWLGKDIISIPKGVSAIAFSGHKIHGPKGIGLLYVRKGCKLEPLLTGGGQEGLRRAGTENLPGIIGLAKAIELLETELPEAIVRMTHLRDQLEKGLSGVIINGTGPRICNTSSITFPGQDGEALLIQLDLQGIGASMGSACSSGSLEPSRVLLHMGLSKQEALSTIRFSLSRFTTEEEIGKTLSVLDSLVSTGIK